MLRCRRRVHLCCAERSRAQDIYLNLLHFNAYLKRKKNIVNNFAIIIICIKKKVHFRVAGV